MLIIVKAQRETQSSSMRDFYFVGCKRFTKTLLPMLSIYTILEKLVYKTICIYLLFIFN